MYACESALGIHGTSESPIRWMRTMQPAPGKPHQGMRQRGVSRVWAEYECSCTHLFMASG